MTMLERLALPDDLVTWRWAALRCAGFDRRLARRVAFDGRFDVDELLALVGRGCPPSLAARILAPLDDPPAVP
jgi:hypothetical protein